MFCVEEVRDKVFLRARGFDLPWEVVGETFEQIRNRVGDRFMAT
jgi:hypothetical protein